eukprot:1689193-Amphidinium_carterae.1
MVVRKVICESTGIQAVDIGGTAAFATCPCNALCHKRAWPLALKEQPWAQCTMSQARIAAGSQGATMGAMHYVTSTAGSQAMGTMRYVTSAHYHWLSRSSHDLRTYNQLPT